MRVFVGIPLSADLQEHVLVWQRRHADCSVRFIKPKNVHITLVPPWDEIGTAEVVTRLRRSTEVSPFVIEYTHIDFNRGRRRSMLWLYGKTPPSLIELRQKLLLQLGKEEEPRPFLLHSTIARFNPKQLSQFRTGDVQEKVEWKMEINKFVLYESLGWSEYKILYEFLL